MTGGDPSHTNVGERRLVASVDRTGARPRIVIEERGGDGASLSALVTATCSLDEWR